MKKIKFAEFDPISQKIIHYEFNLLTQANEFINNKCNEFKFRNRVDNEGQDKGYIRYKKHLQDCLNLQIDKINTEIAK